MSSQQMDTSTSEPMQAVQAPMIKKPKIHLGWKVWLTVLVILNIVILAPHLWLGGFDPATDTEARAGVMAMIVLAPVFLAAPALIFVDIITVFSFLFYLLGRERRYGASTKK